MKVAKLRGLLAEHGYTQARMAEVIGVTTKTFYNKMQVGDFGLREAKAMIRELGITNAELVNDIFFGDE